VTDRLKSYPGALREMKRDGELWRFTGTARAWLNNRVEQDHRRINAGPGRCSASELLDGAADAGRRRGDGDAAKGQVRAVPADDMPAQRAFVAGLFGLAA
jgi:hypothetical protein